MTTGNRKILIVAYPGQGHINPSLRFADRLLKMGVDVTFATSFSVIKSIPKQTTTHGLTFAPFSDGHDNGQQPSTTLQQFVSDLATNGGRAVSEIITSAAAAGQPFDNVVYSTVIPWVAKVAEAHSVKSTLLWCQQATLLDIYYYYHNGYGSLISSNNNNPKFPIDLPGLPPLLVADLPSFFLPSRPKEHDCLLQVVKDHIDAIKMAPRILVNTFNELEIGSIKAIEKLEFLPIGPLIPPGFLERKNSSENPTFEKIDQDGCIQWLDTKPKSSVVYVAFGSQANLSTDQVEEIATGLLRSERPFLWVMRCFVTHGGWNSTMEVIAAGVPLAVIPQWSDQGTNGKMIQDVWKIGVRVKRRDGGLVECKEIERCVEMVMGDGEMRRNAKKWMDSAREALGDGGSSTVNLRAFLNDA